MTVHPTLALEQRHAAYNTPRQNLRTAAGPTLSEALSWPEFWDQVNATLRRCGYRRSTRRQYRHVLRALKRWGVTRPAALTPTRATRFLEDLARDEYSWSWIALHITALRTIFDGLCGLSLTAQLTTPKRPQSLPEILTPTEAERMVRSAGTIHDQLLVGLLYGCGLSGSEAAVLRWRDVRDGGSRLHVPQSTRYQERILPVPTPLRAVLAAGVQTCEPEDYLFRGRAAGTHISTRTIELLVRKLRKAAGVGRPVSVMTLRHSYAVYRLESGADVPTVQTELGHASIRTTERYRRCLAPRLASHPLTKVRARMAKYAASLQSSAPRPSSSAKASEEQPSSVLRPLTSVLRPPSPISRPLENMTSVDLNDLRFPFAPIKRPNAAVAFYRMMKDRVIGGLLRLGRDGP